MPVSIRRLDVCVIFLFCAGLERRLVSRFIADPNTASRYVGQERSDSQPLCVNAFRGVLDAHVRVHTQAQAHHSCRKLHAHAVSIAIQRPQQHHSLVCTPMAMHLTSINVSLLLYCVRRRRTCCDSVYRADLQCSRHSSVNYVDKHCTDFVQPVCSPTRATFATGRHVIHTGVYVLPLQCVS